MGRIASALVVLGLLTQGALAQPTSVSMEWAAVRNAGNAPDPATGFGSVAYEYRIGTREVTNAQYVAFLNAVAASDPNSLFDPRMESDVRGGITRSGSDGSYTYAVKADMADKPVIWVNWFDAARMANWMTNGQGSGDTESGFYTLTGPFGVTGSSFSRDLSNPNQVFIPTRDEWYKAAYHQPEASGGDSDDYWLFATQSNVGPATASATASGDVANPGPGVANYDRDADWNGVSGNVTTVGSAGNTSFYGAFDMNGNVWEWNESRALLPLPSAFRGIRGGSYSSTVTFLQAISNGDNDPALSFENVGFRLAGTLCPADIAEPIGVVDAADITELLTRLDAGDPSADWDGSGVLDFFDVTAYLNDFDACESGPQEIVLRDSIGPDATFTENEPTGLNWSRPGPGNQFYPVYEVNGDNDGLLLTRVDMVGRAGFGFAFDWTYAEFEFRVWSSQSAVELNPEDGDLVDAPISVLAPPQLLPGTVTDNRVASFVLPNGGLQVVPGQTVYFAIVQSNPFFPDELIVPQSSEAGPADFYLNGAGLQPATDVPGSSSGRFGVRFCGIPGQ